MSALSKVERLQRTLVKLAGWNGTDISDLIEAGLLIKGDLDD